jgi:2-polyprenyl-6-methoxyphenol hydroxylase-like FAD-dependent oxidoreductase
MRPASSSTLAGRAGSNELTQHQVIIVGGGPVGLTLAVDLGQRGVDCLLIDKRPEPAFLPKMERCNPRTMEIFRRLGVAEEIRDAGYPVELPLDGFLVTSLVEPPLMRNNRPSVVEMRERDRRRSDGRAPAEPYQVISQYTLEPLLKSIAERTPGVTVRFGCELVSFEESADRVSLVVRGSDGNEETLVAQFLAGCDGASSDVRQGLGYQLEGDPNVGEQTQALFRCDDLYERIPIGQGEHYHVADDRWTFLIVQDDLKHFTLHSRVDDESDMPRLFERIAGMPIDYETLFVGRWTMRLMLADRYASRRVFLAGDSAHLVTPIAGLGMNTGIGDATDLAWKLAGTLQGWGGPALLASYEAERRPVGARNVAASRRAYEARLVWRDMCAEIVGDGADVDDEQRARLGEVALAQQVKGSDITGIIQGYRYLGSPIIARDPDDDGSDQASYEYIATARPGARLPNVWLDDGLPIQDRCGRGYTLISCNGDNAALLPLANAFAELSCPVELLDLDSSPEAGAIYEANYLLLRPDLHVAWRGNELPDEPAALARLVTGNSQCPPSPATGAGQASLRVGSRRASR